MISRFYLALGGLKKRFRLWRISRRLGLRLYPWQRNFALGRTNFLDYPPGAGSGKTTAVMLRLLMLRRADYFEASRILHCDPDFSDGYFRRYDWYWQEYLRLAELCGVNPILDFRRFYMGRGRHG